MTALGLNQPGPGVLMTLWYITKCSYFWDNNNSLIRFIYKIHPLKSLPMSGDANCAWMFQDASPPFSIISPGAQQYVIFLVANLWLDMLEILDGWFFWWRFPIPCGTRKGLTRPCCNENNIKIKVLWFNISFLSF